MDKSKIIISEGVRPMWQTLVAAAFYTMTFILLAMFFFGYEIFPEEGMDNRYNFGVFYIAIACAAQGILFSSVKSIFFDLENQKYKEEYRVGPLCVGNWKALPAIEYVSVFRQLKANGSYTYEVNLWMKGNRSFTIYETGEMVTTFAMGESTAKALKVDLLDATVPNDFKWVDL
ncbi:hypothetical protein H4O18_01270 [Arenibacter sp. BSSL-BM3]|uniref:Uncharacterized protein n=1 Tax=Arenibacter arenosicollis TaxID=2762274 RepID=A0ABR7QHE1_9FLAO|nr:hypothetical protein [Arenibacter arenosicollis]MBC8766611.1 hypothetical protein [Arenibacter arenosicollis]